MRQTKKSLVEENEKLKIEYKELLVILESLVDAYARYSAISGASTTFYLHNEMDLAKKLTEKIKKENEEKEPEKEEEEVLTWLIK